MPSRYLRLDTAPPEKVLQALAALRAELGIAEEFPREVLEEADAVVGLPGADDGDAARWSALTRAEVDASDVPFVTVDPPGSKDLDQAIHIERAGDGYYVRYAIAAVSAFVVPGGAVDAEAHLRGLTAYGPDRSFPLHPPVLSAGAASLLEGQDRPAYVWHLHLDAAGEPTEARVELAVVRSRAQLTYEQLQAAHDGEGALPEKTPADLPQLLQEVGELRQARERDRGGISLEIPEQHVEQSDGGFSLAYRETLPVEGWNAQISLLTGMAAAKMMREAGVGILRTMPDADPRDIARLRRTARALKVSWPDGVSYPELVRSLDSAIPAHAAFLNEATSLFRGAGYLALGVPQADDGAAESGAAEPPTTRHAAIAAEYAHVTAPLRRLVDRYALAVCLAHCEGRPVPDWVLAALPGLPATMAGTARRANAYERGAVDAIEALILESRVGEEFDAVVVDRDEGENGKVRGTVHLADIAVQGRVDGDGDGLPLGETVRVKLVEADVTKRKVRFAPA